MRWQGREQSSNIEDRRGSGGGGGGGMGIIGVIVVLVGAYYGVDLSGLVGGAQQLSGGAQQTVVESKQEAQLRELAGVVLADTEKTWANYFAKRNARYTPTTLVLYTGGTLTQIGRASCRERV